MGILKKLRSPYREPPQDEAPQNEPKKAKIDKTEFIKCQHCGRRVPPDFLEETKKGGIFEDGRCVRACMHCLYDELYPPECQEDE
jgi:hypothetical protein